MTEAGDGLIGAVMVVGGGIGGMQAALDLAEAGFKVYLVESRSEERRVGKECRSRWSPYH